MKAAKLHGPRDCRVEDIPEPEQPGPGEVLVRVGSVGICGSDLRSYQQGEIGDTVVESPLIQGHEFAGTVVAAGADARDGMDRPLTAGQRVAVDPAISCWRCDRCEAGNPNLCRNLRFLGLWPHDGALQERLICPARQCFPIPNGLSTDAGALLETLGVALHAVDLGKLRLGCTVAVFGCGPLGLLITRLARLSGAGGVYAVDRLAWRVDAAKRWGADEAIDGTASNAVETVRHLSGGRGVDVVFEAAWGGEAAEQAVETADLGGRVVMVGIPEDDRLAFRHSTARRKGLTIKMARRMKRAYPRAIALATSGAFDLDELVSHRFPLEDAAAAFALNAAYADSVLKVIVYPQ